MRKLLMLLLIPLLYSCSGESSSETSDGTATVAEEKKNVWSYETDVDKMTGDSNYYATTTSTNEIEFEFPYNGGSTFDIVIRKMDNRTDVLLTVSKGQFMTSIMEEQSISVKFDDEKPSNYAYSSAGDGSSDVLFISNTKKFIDKLKRSKKVMIEASFYDQGNKVIEFEDIAGLQWNR